MGITDHAQSQLGEIVFVDLPDVGEKFSVGDAVTTIESVKTTAEVMAPNGGTVVEVNKQVADNPSLINEEPLKTWIFELICENPPENLLSEEEYKKHLEEEEGH